MMRNDSILGVYKICNLLLKENPEVWLNFSPGQNTDRNLMRTLTPPKFSGVFWRVLAYLYWLYKNTKIAKCRSFFDNSQFVFFSDSLNQYNVLNPLLEEMLLRNVSLRAISDKDLLNYNININSHWEPYSFGFKVAVLSVLLLLIRTPTLIKNLKTKDKRLVSWRLNGFLSVYTWLPFFVGQLMHCRPSMVIVSNDHNPSTRCLISVCKMFSIKTSYLQHASVSSVFHALDFNCSFLDGEESLDAYKSCEGRRSNSSTVLKSRLVYLTGVKRELNSISSNKTTIGIAFKAADDINSIRDIVRSLLKFQHRISIRFHPATSKEVVDQLLNNLCDRKNIVLSNPKEENVRHFFSNLVCLISGNSSIILEASMSNIPTIYHETNIQHSSDYYGFVKNKVCHHATEKTSLESLVLQAIKGKLKANTNSIKRYSETYGTIWQGREQELVANHMLSLMKDSKLYSDLFGFREL